MSLMIGLASIQPVDGIFDSLTSAIANVFTGGPNDGDFYDVTIFGRKVPASEIFNADFTKVRTAASVQSLATILSNGQAQVRDDGAIVGTAAGTLAPAGSVKVANFRALAPATAAAGIPVGTVTGLATGPQWITDEFRRVSTQVRLNNIIAYLGNGAAVVREDGSIGVPNTRDIIAPAGSVNVPLYKSSTGRTVYPVTAVTAAGTSAPTITGPGTTTATQPAAPTTISGALSSIFSGIVSAGVQYGQAVVTAKVSDLYAKNAPTTQMQEQQRAIEAERLRLQSESQYLQQQFTAAQQELARQAAAQQDEARRAQLEAAAAAAKVRHEAEISQRLQEVERLKREAESLKVTASLPVSGSAIMPALIQPALSTFLPQVQPVFQGAPAAYTPAFNTDLDSQIETRSAQVFASPTSGIPGWAWGLGAAVLVGGVFMLSRRSAPARRRRR